MKEEKNNEQTKEHLKQLKKAVEIFKKDIVKFQDLRNEMFNHYINSGSMTIFQVDILNRVNQELKLIGGDIELAKFIFSSLIQTILRNVNSCERLIILKLCEQNFLAGDLIHGNYKQVDSSGKDISKPKPDYFG